MCSSADCDLIAFLKLNSAERIGAHNHVRAVVPVVKRLTVKRVPSSVNHDSTLLGGRLRKERLNFGNILGPDNDGLTLCTSTKATKALLHRFAPTVLLL